MGASDRDAMVNFYRLLSCYCCCLVDVAVIFLSVFSREADRLFLSIDRSYVYTELYCRSTSRKI
jgi:hypothetical protein